jgi:hypothetical protein
MKEPTREDLERLLRDAGHAINANNGRCGLIEDVLCRVTSLCVYMLNVWDGEPDETDYRRPG